MTNDRVVLVTGASSGIGKCCADYLAQRKFRVYGTSRKAQWDNANLKTSLSFEMIPMDVTDDASVQKAIEYILDRESQIDVVINNAGFALIGALEDTAIEEAKSQFETNFFGVLRVCRSVLPIMRPRNSGYIINISSIGGQIGLPFQSIYCASKFAVEGAMEALRMEVKPFGIHVVLIEPGDFNTEITSQRQKTEKSTKNSAYQSTFKKVLQTVASGELKAPTPEPIAILIHNIINISSPRPRYTVGKISQRTAVLLKKILPSCLFEYLIAHNFQAN